MKFEPVKVLEKIRRLYELPLGRSRFEEYLKLLQGVDGKEMILPIASFNPMGKELAVRQLDHLIALDAEEILEEIIKEFNAKKEVTEIEHSNIMVAINLVDDVEGSWSNYSTTDYTSKFDLGPMLKRNFCVPIFWTSEEFNRNKLIRRIKESIYRIISRILRGNPESLREVLAQEVSVQMNFDNPESTWSGIDIDAIQAFYRKHMDTQDYAIKSNFFYGDEASKKLNYPSYGIALNSGFGYAKYLSERKKKAQH